MILICILDDSEMLQISNLSYAKRCQVAVKLRHRRQFAGKKSQSFWLRAVFFMRSTKYVRPGAGKG